eukprot:gene2990-3733_t
MRNYIRYAKDYLTLSIPLVVSGLVYTMMPLADSMMVAKLGKYPLAAASLANTLFIACSMIPRGIVYGLTPLVAAAHAKRQYTKMVKLLQHALYLNITLGVLFAMIIWLVSFLLPFFKQELQVSELAQPYLQMLAISLVPMMILNTFIRYLEGISCTKHLVSVNLVGIFIKVLLNYLFIRDYLGGMRQVSIHGIGYASIASATIMMLCIVLYVGFSPELRKYRIRFSRRPLHFRYFRKLAKLGIPVGLQFGLERAAFAFMAVMAGWVGPAQLAANAVVSHIIEIALNINWAISIAASTLVSKPFSLRNKQMIKQVGFTGFVFGGVVAGMVCLLMVYVYDALLAIYTADVEVIQIASSLVFIAVLFNIIDSIYTVGLGVLRGMQSTVHPLLIANGSIWLIGLPMCYIMAFRLGHATV